MTLKYRSSLVLTAMLVLTVSVTSPLPVSAEKQTGERYAINDIKSSIQKATPHVTMSDHIVTFDEESASSTMSAHEIQITKDFISMQNEYVQDVKSDPDQKHELNQEKSQKFSELKKQVNDSEDSVMETGLTQWILPEAFAWSDVCGGSFDNRHDEYTKKDILSRPTQSSAESVLSSWGYHEVEAYATYPGATLSDSLVDFAKEQTAYGCDGGEIRKQIVLEHKNDTRWHFMYQIKEPNPEILSYDSPVWWWSTYTALWHLNADEGNRLITEW